jgi:UDP-GlcNAc:undecaprenyl-phosphate GlcNAc-1-phosphate transferase
VCTAVTLSPLSREKRREIEAQSADAGTLEAEVKAGDDPLDAAADEIKEP